MVSVYRFIFRISTISYICLLLAGVCNTYSPLHTICRCLRTMTKVFFQKNMSFAKCNEKRTHTIRYRPQFSLMCVSTENTPKKVFWICQKLPTQANAFHKKVFHKMLTNLTNYSSHEFRLFVPFSSLFANGA